VTAGRWRTLRRAAFWCYVLILFTATHTPGVEVPFPQIRLDLFVHVGAFGLWAALLIGAGFFGPPLSNRNILAVLAIAPVYAALDEWLQKIPFIHRHAAVDDWAANVTGIILACIGAVVLRRILERCAAPP
jgi:VanZ family protein